MTKTRQIKVFMIAAAAALALGLAAMLAASPVEAAFPGKNGKIAFVSNRDVGSGEIYTVKPDGTGAARITFPTGGNGDPAFSSDGAKIAFKGGSNDIYVMGANGMNPDGTGAQRITNTAVVESDPAWSPDGTKIAFVASAFEVDGSTDFEIWVMNADGTGRTLLTNNTFPDTQPAWSPDGTRIAFVSARNAPPFNDTDRNVYVMNADGSGQANLTPDTSDPVYQGNDDSPSWSPDGTRIAYSNGLAGGEPEIWTMDSTNGSGKDNVTDNDVSISDTEPTWSPDGTKIAYVASVASTNRDIYTMNADGTGQGVLHSDANNDVKPDWQQDSIPPQTTITSGPPALTRSTTAGFGFVSSETGSTFQCSLDGAPYASCASPKSYGSLKSGKHTFRVRATDVAGNVDLTPATRIWTVDAIKPTVSGMTPRHTSIITDTTPAIKATVKDNLTNLQKANIKLYVNGTLISPTKYTYSAATDLLTYNSPKLSAGKKTIKVVATDKAGNVGARSWSFTIR